jgi:hypothetical protein
MTSDPDGDLSTAGEPGAIWSDEQMQAWVDGSQ